MRPSIFNTVHGGALVIMILYDTRGYFAPLRIVIRVLIPVTSHPLFSIPCTSACANDEDLVEIHLLYSNYHLLLVNDAAQPSPLAWCTVHGRITHIIVISRFSRCPMFGNLESPLSTGHRSWAPRLDEIHKSTSDDGWSTLKKAVSTLFEESAVLDHHLVLSPASSSPSPPPASHEDLSHQPPRNGNSSTGTGPPTRFHLR